MARRGGSSACDELSHTAERGNACHELSHAAVRTGWTQARRSRVAGHCSASHDVSHGRSGPATNTACYDHVSHAAVRISSHTRRSVTRGGQDRQPTSRRHNLVCGVTVDHHKWCYSLRCDGVTAHSLVPCVILVCCHSDIRMEEVYGLTGRGNRLYEERLDEARCHLSFWCAVTEATDWKRQDWIRPPSEATRPLTTADGLDEATV